MTAKGLSIGQHWRRRRPHAKSSKGPIWVPSDRSRILLVDDEEGIRLLFRSILASELPNVGIDIAKDGVEAVHCFDAGHHAVLLMDLCMPNMDGRVAFDTIHTTCSSRGWEMPSVVFCSGFAPPDAVLELVEHSPQHALLSKPVRGEVLVEAVRSRLTSPR